jgi:hypothetical protein
MGGIMTIQDLLAMGSGMKPVIFLTNRKVGQIVDCFIYSVIYAGNDKIDPALCLTYLKHYSEFMQWIEKK